MPLFARRTRPALPLLLPRRDGAECVLLLADSAPETCAVASPLRNSPTQLPSRVVARASSPTSAEALAVTLSVASSLPELS